MIDPVCLVSCSRERSQSFQARRMTRSNGERVGGLSGRSFETWRGSETSSTILPLKEARVTIAWSERLLSRLDSENAFPLGTK
jgi:hypothetical protein